MYKTTDTDCLRYGKYRPDTDTDYRSVTRCHYFSPHCFRLMYKLFSSSLVRIIPPLFFSKTSNFRNGFSCYGATNLRWYRSDSNLNTVVLQISSPPTFCSVTRLAQCYLTFSIISTWAYSLRILMICCAAVERRHRL